MAPADLISAAAIILGFGVTAVMFRVQRELYVFEELKERLLWLAWADYLILASVALAVFGVLVPLLVLPPTASHSSIASIASALCVAAVVLQAGYIPSILAHYRIELGARRTGSREKGEPAERLCVVVTVVVALVAFVATLWIRLVCR